MLERVGNAQNAEMPDMIWKTTQEILSVSSETTTSSDGFSDTIDAGVIAVQGHEHMQQDVCVTAKNMLT